MSSAASVLVCALSVLGRDPRTVPPIEFVDTPPPGVSRNAEAFTKTASNVIYLITSSAAFETARIGSRMCGDFSALAKIASVIVHEEWHLRHGADETGAYDAQLLTLMKLGIGPGMRVYDGVWRSRRAVLASQGLDDEGAIRRTGQSRLRPARTPPSVSLNRAP